jgi:hypothetical protein
MNFRRAVIVLGAGASKGAELSGRKTPPLDSDFLKVTVDYFSRKRARGKGKSIVKAWNDFRKNLTSAGLNLSIIRDWRLEQLSTFLEARANLKGMQLEQGRPREYATALESLKRIVCHILSVEGGTQSCPLHKSLFQMTSPKAVISFNYDMIADQSLAELGLLNWKSAQYRCARFASIPVDTKRTQYQSLYSSRHDGHVPLLKLHGSMHYEKLIRGTGYRLSGTILPTVEEPTFDYLRVPKNPYIIPPIAAKIGISQTALRERWYEALHYLHEAPVWIFWGYSFPTTDTISHVLFRTALKNNRKPKPVIVINPDYSVPTRVREVCQKVKIEHFPSIERLLMENRRLGLIDHRTESRSPDGA